MTDVRDDPREVLALLNSLGFVGITGPQLKAFMKDLKMYRKVKERERQQWKEETRKKIISKQEHVLKEMLHDVLTSEGSNSLENTPSSESSIHDGRSMVRIRVHCIPDDESNEDIENEGRRNNNQASVPKRQVFITNGLCRKDSNRNIDATSNSENGHSRRHKKEESKLAEISANNNLPKNETEKSVRRIREGNIPARPLSAPEFADRREIPKQRSKSVASDPTGIAHGRNIPSRCSSRSQTKSFIRPWRLQPEAQRPGHVRKSDPVALYQKYQQEWKQISFPGEEQHARVRWAVREKMLGIDPNPRPILKKSQSLMSIKKR